MAVHQGPLLCMGVVLLSLVLTMRMVLIGKDVLCGAPKILLIDGDERQLPSSMLNAIHHTAPGGGSHDHSGKPRPLPRRARAVPACVACLGFCLVSHVFTSAWSGGSWQGVHATPWVPTPPARTWPTYHSIPATRHRLVGWALEPARNPTTAFSHFSLLTSLFFFFFSLSFPLSLLVRCALHSVPLPGDRSDDVGGRGAVPGPDATAAAGPVERPVPKPERHARPRRCKR